MQELNKKYIYIIKTGVSNVGSIHNMYKKIGIPSKIIDNPNELTNPSRIILPGVGSFDNGIKSLKKNGFFDVIVDSVLNNKIPILGICLGMQMLTNGSEEGNLSGLSFIDAYCKKFINSSDEVNIKIPHMGWNYAYPYKQDKILDNMPQDMRFYFVHSFFPVCNEINDIVAKTKYGLDFASIISKNHIYGTQFHPEKSHKFGIQLLRNFANI